VIPNTMAMARALDHAACMATALGDRNEAARHQALARRLRLAVNTHGWSEAHRAYVDTMRDDTAYEHHRARAAQQGVAPTPREDFNRKLRISEQTNTLALLCDVAPPERRDRALEHALAARQGAYMSSAPWLAFLGSTDQVVPVGTPF